MKLEQLLKLKEQEAKDLKELREFERLKKKFNS